MLRTKTVSPTAPWMRTFRKLNLMGLGCWIRLSRIRERDPPLGDRAPRGTGAADARARARAQRRARGRPFVVAAGRSSPDACGLGQLPPQPHPPHVRTESFGSKTARVRGALHESEQLEGRGGDGRAEDASLPAGQRQVLPWLRVTHKSIELEQSLQSACEPLDSPSAPPAPSFSLTFRS